MEAVVQIKIEQQFLRWLTIKTLTGTNTCYNNRMTERLRAFQFKVASGRLLQATGHTTSLGVLVSLMVDISSLDTHVLRGLPVWDMATW